MLRIPGKFDRPLSNEDETRGTDGKLPSLRLYLEINFLLRKNPAPSKFIKIHASNQNRLIRADAAAKEKKMTKFFETLIKVKFLVRNEKVKTLNSIILMMGYSYQ